MNNFLIFLILITLILTLVLVYFIGINKLQKFKEKMDKAESIIDTNLNEKLDIIINLNGSIKKVIGKKDYLKDFVNIRDLIITNIEKDLKLNDAVKLINDLIIDYSELNNDKDFIKNLKRLREIDEVLVSAKNVYNQNSIQSNKLIKNFPYNIIAKIAKFKIHSFYNNNKTDDGDAF